MIDTYTLDDFRVGDRVRAFHPRTLGVMHWGSVTRVGRKWLTVAFRTAPGVYRIDPRDVSDIVGVS